MQPLEPLAYQAALRDYLKERESELWQWFSSAQAQADYAESLRLDLLKHTYRLDPNSHPELFRQAAAVSAKLELAIPVTIYQSQQSRQLNAGIYYIPGEAHIVLEGDVLSLLDSGELACLLAHELAHYRLWQEQGGDLLVVARLLQAIAFDPRAEPSHVESARRFQLYTEIYADRGALLASENIATAISSLVKMLTGMKQVSADSYLQQAEEIFAKSASTAEGITHPEGFIRARALKLWSDGLPDADAEIQRMIEGGIVLDELDLLGQRHLTELTRRLITVLLEPKWFQTDATLGQARLYFDDFKPGAKSAPDDTLVADLQFADSKVQDYLCYVMLDFAMSDPELDQVPLAAGYVLAGRLNLIPKWEAILAKELKIPKKELARIQRDAVETLEKTVANQGIRK